MILGRYVKQPSEVSDYDVDFTPWLRSGETVSTASSTVVCTSDATNTSLVVDATTTSSQSVRVRLSGGTDRQTYKVTLLTDSSSGRTDESEFIVKVREF